MDENRPDPADGGGAALDDWLKRRALANEASGASRTYVMSPVTLPPADDTRVERREIVPGVKVPGRTDVGRLAVAHRSQGGWDASSRRNLGLAAGDLSRAAVNRLYAFASRWKSRRPSNTAVASRQAASSMNSDRFFPAASAARSIKARR